MLQLLESSSWWHLSISFSIASFRKKLIPHSIGIGIPWRSPWCLTPLLSLDVEIWMTAFMVLFRLRVLLYKEINCYKSPIRIRIGWNACVLQLPSEVCMWTCNTVAKRLLPSTSYGSYEMFNISASEFCTVGMCRRMPVCADEFLAMVTEGVVHSVVTLSSFGVAKRHKVSGGKWTFRPCVTKSHTNLRR